MPDQAFAATDGREARLTVRGSGLKVPRFVTLKSDDVNMRAGPGRNIRLPGITSVWGCHCASRQNLRSGARWLIIRVTQGDASVGRVTTPFALGADGSARIWQNPAMSQRWLRSLNVTPFWNSNPAYVMQSGVWRCARLDDTHRPVEPSRWRGAEIASQKRARKPGIDVNMTGRKSPDNASDEIKPVEIHHMTKQTQSH